MAIVATIIPDALSSRLGNPTPIQRGVTRSANARVRGLPFSRDLNTGGPESFCEGAYYPCSSAPICPAVASGS